MLKPNRLFEITGMLLKVATLFCLFLIAVLALAFGAVTLAMAGLLTLPIPASELHGLSVDQIFAAATLALGGGLICIALVAWIFLLTGRIIDFASTGDPFVTENADRLNRIACLLLAIQLVGLAVDAAMNLFPKAIAENVSVGFDGFSASGILATLLIFVLAQIFRHGSRMRAELEGTV
jgi:hypothetical protein